MKKKEILLPSKRYFKANEEDLTLNVKLENSESLMREGERNIILDLPTLYDDERNQSKNYKIYGKMKMIFLNLYSGSTSYNPLLKISMLLVTEREVMMGMYHIMNLHYLETMC